MRRRWPITSVAVLAIVFAGACVSPSTPAVPTSSAVSSGFGSISVTLAADPVDAAARADQLREAAARGDLGAVRPLLGAGATVDAADGQGRTALVRAAYGNHVEVAAALAAAGADVNHKDRTEQSAYLIATSEVGDDPRLLELTLAHQADVRSLDSWRGTGLIRAAHRGFPRVIARLLSAGCPVDHVNRLGWTALHEAIILGDGSAAYVEVVGLLVRAGADVNLASARDGRRPLTLAQSRGHQQIAALLVAAGARR